MHGNPGPEFSVGQNGWRPRHEADCPTAAAAQCETARVWHYPVGCARAVRSITKFDAQATRGICSSEPKSQVHAELRTRCVRVQHSNGRGRTRGSQHDHVGIDADPGNLGTGNATKCAPRYPRSCSADRDATQLHRSA
jgi:hypothetical protein